MINAEGLDGACRCRGHYGDYSGQREVSGWLRGWQKGERGGFHHTVVPGLRSLVEEPGPGKLQRVMSDSECR